MTSRLHSARVASSLVLLILAGACKQAPDPPEAPASPQASADPTPLTTLPATASATPAAAADAAPPPVAMRGDEPLPPDTISRDLAGYTLEGILRPGDAPAAAKGPEVNAAGLDAARKRAESSVVIDLAPGRMRLALSGRGFVLPAGTELRGRSDRYGVAVIWPEPRVYHVAPPGALRALLGDRRLDVGPLSAAQIVPAGEGARRLGYPTRKVTVTGRAGTGTFEIARVADGGEGGVLLARVLLELLAAAPSTPLSSTDEIPLHVDFKWSPRGSMVFDATSIVRRLDLGAAQVGTPPPGVGYARGGVSPRPSELLLSPAELAQMRNGAEHDKDLPRNLALVNGCDELRLAWLDGVPIAWLMPGARADIGALPRGRYSIEWRSFFGDAAQGTRHTTTPGTSECGALDGG